MRILLVEDDKRVATAMSSALTRRGYDVKLAATAAAALSAAPCDLVLLDLSLPYGDGLEVCRALRQRSSQTVTMDDRPIALTRKEFDILLSLARHPGLVITRDRILLDVWQTTWLVLIALETPLALTLASQESDEVRADRLADATRFAALSRPVLRENAVGTIRDELNRYDELYVSDDGPGMTDAQ